MWRNSASEWHFLYKNTDQSNLQHNTQSLLKTPFDSHCYSVTLIVHNTIQKEKKTQLFTHVFGLRLSTLTNRSMTYMIWVNIIIQNRMQANCTLKRALTFCPDTWECPVGYSAECTYTGVMTRSMPLYRGEQEEMWFSHTESIKTTPSATTNAALSDGIRIPRFHGVRGGPDPMHRNPDLRNVAVLLSCSVQGGTYSLLHRRTCCTTHCRIYYNTILLTTLPNCFF